MSNRAGRRICGTPAWKSRRRAARGLAAPAPTGAVVGPLFEGTVYLANIEFRAAHGPVSVPPEDLATVRQYLSLAAGPLRAYCSQYGPCSVASGRLLPPYATPPLSGAYSDADLQGWIDAIVTQNRLGADSAVLVLNPPGAVNKDARESGGVGVLGYHGLASRPYSFVNLLGTGFTTDDRADLYAEAVSHELAEMTVDPRADDSNPEVCDGCGTNCQGAAAYRAYFGDGGSYLTTAPEFPPAVRYAFFLSAVARPAYVTKCPAPAQGCAYPPPVV